MVINESTQQHSELHIELHIIYIYLYHIFIYPEQSGFPITCGDAPGSPSIQIPSISRCFTMTSIDSLILKKPLFLVQPEWFDDVWPVYINQPSQVIQWWLGSGNSSHNGLHLQSEFEFQVSLNTFGKLHCSFEQLSSAWLLGWSATSKPDQHHLRISRF